MSNQRKRNFQIEAFKHKVVVDPKYAEKTWKILEHAIHEIYNHNASGLSFEELYRNAYNMVLHKFGDKLYSGLTNTMTSHLKEISRHVEVAQGGSFLEELNRKWADHNKALQMIRDILMYMDRTYVPSSHRTPVYELGLNLWRDYVIHSINIKTRLLNTLLELILRERTGEVINRGLMRNVTKMLMDLGSSVYQEDFEKPFLEVSADFYRVESQRFIECCDCGDYLKKAERRLNEEIDRVSHYLDAKSESKITSVVEKEMIANHMQRLVHMENSGLVNMLLDDKYQDLGRMYSLFRRVPNGLTNIRDVMTSHIRDVGKQLVTDPEKVKDPVEFVQRLLDEKDKYDKIINSAFSNDKTFQNALNSSFEYFINLNPRSPEFISLFVDDKLRKGLKGVSEEDVEVILDKVMMLFRYLQEKDVFEKYYKQHLAKRLLSGKTVSDDAERSLIVKLKTECGYQFTSKLEGMFTDMKTSQDTMQGFYASQGSEIGDGPTLVVQVLTTGSWPTQPCPPCNLPAEVSGLCEKFRSYYLGTHTGRRLTWQTNMGTADIKAVFGKGQRHELNVSTYQMCVLMLFNNTDRLSYKEIEQATEIPATELKRCLQSLACVKIKGTPSPLTPFNIDLPLSSFSSSRSRTSSSGLRTITGKRKTKRPACESEIANLSTQASHCINRLVLLSNLLYNISIAASKSNMARGLAAAVLILAIITTTVRGEDPYRFFEWNVTYGTIWPLGIPQQGILINGQFPGPDIHSVTNDNLIINVFNSLDEPFLISWNGIQNRKNSYEDGVAGTTCPIPPGHNFTYILQVKDQIGSFFYFPSLGYHKAAGGFGGVRILSRPRIPVPFPTPAADYTILIGDWYHYNHTKLRKILDWGHKLPNPTSILINGRTSGSTLTIDQGTTIRLRISNVGLQNTLNFRIQDHTLTLVEVEGTHTVQTKYSSLDIHLGQSYSVLVTADQPSKDYHIAVSSRFTSKILESSAILHYSNSQTAVSGPLPGGPTDQIGWSLEQARSIRMNLTASGPRPNPQGSYHYGLVNTTRTIRLANSAGQVNGKQRYAVNSVSYVAPDTPLKVADYFKIDGVFKVGSIPYAPTGGGIYLDTAVMQDDYRGFVEIVFENKENIVQSWHLNGYNFFVVGMDGGKWSEESRNQYNLRDAVFRCTVEVYPRSWTAIYVALDNVGMWNLRSEFWARQYLGQQFYLRVYTTSTSLRDEYPIPKNALLCGRAEGRNTRSL